MHRFSAQHFVILSNNMARLQSFIDEPPQRWNALAGPEPADTRSQTVEMFLAALKDACSGAGLEHSAELIDGCLEDIPKTSEFLKILLRSIINEMKRCVYLRCPAERSSYWENDKLLSPQTRDRFPNVAGEIRSASTAYSYGLWVSCVFHAMRAAELGLRVLANDLGVTFPHGDLTLEQWLPIISQMEAKIKAIGDEKKSTDKAERQKFYSQAAAQFRYFKDGYRVRVAHVHDPFSQNQALSILNQTCQFFDVLAERLYEPI